MKRRVWESVTTAEPRWLLFLHRITPGSDYTRVKIWRRLQSLGAVAIRKSVYVLPAGEQAREDLQWVQKEVEQGGGEATICDVRFLDGLRDEDVEALFNEARDKEYASLAEDVQEVLDGLPEELLNDDPLKSARSQFRRLKKRFDQIAALDHFGASRRGDVEGLLSALHARLYPPGPTDDAAGDVLSPTDVKGRTWVTRRGVHVDRMASAWLIRRFIDRDARFRFVADGNHSPAAGELRFDMFAGEFTHEGNACTFEVLIRRFGLNDRGLPPIAEIVHDIDLKDARFGREETAGVAAAVAGICLQARDDEKRRFQGDLLFESLFRFFSAGRPVR